MLLLLLLLFVVLLFFLPLCKPACLSSVKRLSRCAVAFCEQAKRARPRSALQLLFTLDTHAAVAVNQRLLLLLTTTIFCARCAWFSRPYLFLFSVSEMMKAMMKTQPEGNDDLEAAQSALCALFRSENLAPSRVSCAFLEPHCQTHIQTHLLVVASP